MRISVPTSWEGVTLRQFQQITQQLKESSERLKTLKGSARDKFEYESECVLISTLTGADIDDIMSMSRSAHNHIMNQLGFISQPIQGKPVKTVKVNGRRYRFELNAKNINGGQWISLMHFMQDENKVDENLHNLLACFAMRVKWFRAKYDGKKHEEVAKDMLDLPVSTVKPITDFFLQDWLRYAKRTAVFLEYMGKGLKRKAERELKRSSVNTDGYTPSTT